MKNAVKLSIIFAICFVLLLKVNADDYVVTLSTRDRQYAGTANEVSIIVEGSLSNTSHSSLGSKFPRLSTEKRTFSDINVGFICGVSLTLHGGDGWRLRNLFVSNVNHSSGRFFVVDRELDGDFGRYPNGVDKLTIREPVDAVYGEYGSWSSCNATCGENGTEIRRRVCDKSKMGCGGQTCQGPNMETKVCLGPPCTTSTSTTISTSSASFFTLTQTLPTEPEMLVSSNCQQAPLIAIGVVLAFSLILSALLTIFLIIVLKDKKKENRQKLIKQESIEPSHVYGNSTYRMENTQE